MPKDRKKEEKSFPVQKRRKASSQGRRTEIFTDKKKGSRAAQSVEGKGPLPSGGERERNLCEITFRSATNFYKKRVVPYSPTLEDYGKRGHNSIKKSYIEMGNK